MNTKVIFVEQNGIQVPHLVADREMVLFYFDYRKQRDEIYDQLQNIDPNSSGYVELFKVYKEFKARCHRLEKAIYFQCEETGELRLFSSLTLYNDKIVWTKVPRDEKRLEQRKIKEEIKMNTKKAQQLAKQQRKEQRLQKRKELSLAKRGKTELECQIMDGRITDEDLQNVSMEIQINELKEEMRQCSTYFRGDVAQLEKFAMHNIVLKRVREYKARKETEKFMEGIKALSSVMFS